MLERDKEVLVWNPETPQDIEWRTMPKELEQMYELIGCHTIDIVTRELNGKTFSMIVDDEGLLLEKMPSYYDEKTRTYLVGTIIITQYNEEGEQVGLTREEIEHIAKTTKMQAAMLK